MRRHATLGLALVLLMGTLAGCAAQPPDEEPSAPLEESPPPARDAPPAQAEDPGPRYALDAPDGWEPLDYPGATMLFRATEGNADDFRATFNVMEASEGLAAASAEEIKQQSLEMLAHILTDFDLEHAEVTDVEGQPAIELLYHGRQGTLNLTFHQVVLLWEDATATATLTLPESEAASVVAQGEAALASFRPADGHAAQGQNAM